MNKRRSRCIQNFYFQKFKFQYVRLKKNEMKMDREIGKEKKINFVFCGHKWCVIENSGFKLKKLITEKTVKELIWIFIDYLVPLVISGVAAAAVVAEVEFVAVVVVGVSIDDFIGSFEPSSVFINPFKSFTDFKQNFFNCSYYRIEKEKTVKVVINQILFEIYL